MSSINLPSIEKRIEAEEIQEGDTILIHRVWKDAYDKKNNTEEITLGVVNSLDTSVIPTRVIFAPRNSIGGIIRCILFSSSDTGTTNIYLLDRPKRFTLITHLRLKTLPLGTIVKINTRHREGPLEGPLVSRRESILLDNIPTWFFTVRKNAYTNEDVSESNITGNILAQL